LLLFFSGSVFIHKSRATRKNLCDWRHTKWTNLLDWIRGYTGSSALIRFLRMHKAQGIGSLFADVYQFAHQ